MHKDEPKIIGIGDLHISSRKGYYREAFARFMSWFDEQDFGPRENNVIVLSGDIHNSINICTTEAAMFDLAVESFFKKAKEVWCCPGNHDYGLVGYLKDSIHEYLDMHNVKWVGAPQTIEFENGLSCLFLPFDPKYASNSDTLNEIIETMPRADCCVSHYELKPHFTDNFVQLDYPCERIIGGHLHNRGSGLEYCGSILPCSRDDDKIKAPSVIKIVQKADDESIKIPAFVKFDFVSCDRFGSVDALTSHLQSSAFNCEKAGQVYQAILQYSQRSSGLLQAIKNVNRNIIYQVEKIDEAKAAKIDVKQTNAIFSKPKILESYFLANPNRKLLIYCYNKIKETANDKTL